MRIVALFATGFDLAATSSTTALGLLRGASESLLGQLGARQPFEETLHSDEDSAPESSWPRPRARARDCYPPDHIEEYVHTSLQNAGLEASTSCISYMGGCNAGRRRGPKNG